MNFEPNLPVETERLRLRQFSRGDVDAVYAYRRREDVATFLFDDPMTRESCAEAVQQRIAEVTLQEDGDKLLLAVERRDNVAMIGEMSLILRSETARQGEIGYIFHPDAHGQGFATEASRAVLALGFDGAGLHRIYARCSPENIASYRVMERLGLRREAHFRHNALVKGKWSDELVYAILEDEWPNRAGLSV